MNIKKIKAKNYLSFKSLNLDLSDKDGTYLIIGRNNENVDDTEGNGSGKTSFASLTTFALYGRCRGNFDKDLHKEDIIYIDDEGKRADKCEVEIEFDHDGCKYNVKRKINAKGNQTLSLGIFDNDENKFNDLTLKAGINKRTGKRENGIIRTQQRINDILGCDANLFINSVYFEQSNIDTFATGTLGEKDDLIKSVAGIYRWGDYALTMSKDLSDNQNKLTKLSALIDDYGDPLELQKSMDEFQELLLKNNKSIKIEENKKDQLKTQLSELTKQKEQADKTQYELASIHNKISELDKLKENYQQSHTWANNALYDAVKNEQHCIEQMKKHNEKLTQLNAIIGQEKPNFDINARDLLLGEIQETNKRIGIYQYQLDEITQKVHQIPNMSCPFNFNCVELTPSNKEKIKANYQLEYNQILKKINFMNMKLKKKNDDLTKMKKIADIVVEIEKAGIELELVQEAVKATDQVLRKSIEYKNKENEKINDLKGNIDQCDKELNTLRKKLGSIENLDTQKLMQEIFKIQEAMEFVDRDITNLIKTNAEIESYLKNIKTRIDKAQDIKKEFEGVNDTIQLIKHSLGAVRKDIPHLLIKNVIPELEYSCREFLYKLSDGRMDMQFVLHKELKTKSDGSNMANAFDIVVEIDGNKTLKYGQISGGERARVDVAIHLAYVCFIASRSGRKLQNIWMDEVGMALDEKGVQVFVDIINQLRNLYDFKKIFVITQNTKMKKMFDNVLTVVKTNKGSKLLF